MARFKAVLFDWRGTLFHDESDEDWFRASAASIGRTLSDAEVAGLAQGLAASESHPDVAATRPRADCSVELHTAATLLQLRVAGFDDELALAVLERDGNLVASFPYPDAAEVLRALKARGARVAVISDIHYDLRPHFAAHGLADYIDAYVLSYQHRRQKPDPQLFLLALQALRVDAGEALMVGDRTSRDAGAVAAGIATLILPPVPDFSVRGLEAALKLVDALPLLAER